MAQKTNPAKNAEAITPSDSVNLDRETRGIYIGVGGDISVEMHGAGSAVLFVGAVTGSILPIQVTRVNSTNTTATTMIALY